MISTSQYGVIYALPKNKRAKWGTISVYSCSKRIVVEEALIQVEILIVFPLGDEANGVLIRRKREITTSMEGRHVCGY